MKEFEERYKSFDNRKLLRIIEESENYQSIAVEAAKAEILSREISEEEINSVKKEISEMKSRSEERQKAVKAVETKAKVIGTEFIATISPIQKEAQTTNRKINLIIIIFGFLSVYQIGQESGMIKFMFLDSLARWDFSMVLYFIPIILIPIATILFWMRNRIGWILMGAFMVYNIVNTIIMFFLTWKWNEIEYISDFPSGDFQIEIHEIESIISQSNPIIYLAIITFFGGTFWLINKNDVRALFKIDNKSALITIGLSGFITSIIILGLTW